MYEVLKSRVDAILFREYEKSIREVIDTSEKFYGHRGQIGKIVHDAFCDQERIELVYRFFSQSEIEELLEKDGSLGNALLCFSKTLDKADQDVVGEFKRYMIYLVDALAIYNEDSYVHLPSKDINLHFREQLFVRMLILDAVLGFEKRLNNEDNYLQWKTRQYQDAYNQVEKIAPWVSPVY